MLVCDTINIMDVLFNIIFKKNSSDGAQTVSQSIKQGKGVIDLCSDWKHNPLLPLVSPPTVWIIPSRGTQHRL